MAIIFGEADPRDYKRRKSDSQPNGYAARPGTGPAGEYCKTCAHFYQHKMSRTYSKCSLMRHIWTGGSATDIKVNSPACARFEKNEG